MLFIYFKRLLKDYELMKKCVVIAIPIMLQTLVVSSVNLVDNLMVGRLGDASLSAVVSANKYYYIINFAINALTATCVIFMSQFNGAKNIQKMRETFRFSFIVSYLIIIISFIVVIFFPSQLMRFIIDDAEIIGLGTTYLEFACFSFLPIGITMCVSAAMRTVGDSKTPLFISALSIAINAILDYVLIFGELGLPELGIKGAAIATIIARVIEAFLYLYLLNKGEYCFKTSIYELFNFDHELAKNIVIKALPLFINEVLWQFGMTMLFKAYSYRGATINTAYSISATVADLFFILFSGMATSTTILIGNPLGANELDKAKDNAYELLVFSVLLSFVFGLGLFLSQFIVVYIYPSVSSEAIAATKKFLSYMGYCYGIYMFNTQCYFTLRAGGDTKSTMFMDSGYMWLINIPVVCMLSYLTSIPIYLVYLIGQLTDIPKGFVAYRLVRKEKWVKNLAIENS